MISFSIQLIDGSIERNNLIMRLASRAWQTEWNECAAASWRRLQLFEVFAQLCQHSTESLSLAHTHTHTWAHTESAEKCHVVGGLRTHICSPLVFVIIVITPYLNCSRSKLALALPLPCRCHTVSAQSAAATRKLAKL